MLMVEDTSSFGKARIRELLVLVCLLLRWIDSVVNVVRVNERMMYVMLVIGKQIVNIVSAYAPQVGLSTEEKDDFWDSFIIVLSGIPKQESIFIGTYQSGDNKSMIDYLMVRKTDRCLVNDVKVISSE